MDIKGRIYIYIYIYIYIFLKIINNKVAERSEVNMVKYKNIIICFISWQSIVVYYFTFYIFLNV